MIPSPPPSMICCARLRNRPTGLSSPARIAISLFMTQSFAELVSDFELIDDSDALIVKGLIAVVFLMFKGLSKAEIVAYDAQDAFTKLGLTEHLTPQRSNGVASMVKRIKAYAVEK